MNRSTAAPSIGRLRTQRPKCSTAKTYWCKGPALCLRATRYSTYSRRIGPRGFDLMRALTVARRNTFSSTAPDFLPTTGEERRKDYAQLTVLPAHKITPARESAADRTPRNRDLSIITLMQSLA